MLRRPCSSRARCARVLRGGVAQRQFWFVGVLRRLGVVQERTPMKWTRLVGRQHIQ